MTCPPGIITQGRGHFSGFVAFSSFLKAVGGSLAQSLLHLILRVCWNQYQVNRLLLGLIVSRFGCLTTLLAIPANFLPYRHFLHAHFSGFFTFHSKMKTKGEVFHINSHFSLSSFAGMYTPRHTVLKGPWQFPFPVLTGLKVPVYKMKFVIRKFLLGGRLPPGSCYHQLRPNQAASQVATFY